MARMRSLRSNCSCFGFFLYVLFIPLFIVGVYGDVQCLSASASPIDWFIVYKLPLLPGDKKYGSGENFFYMDSVRPDWMFSDVEIGQPGHAVYSTLQQIYKNYTGTPDSMFLMYNDEKPHSHSAILSHGHTKGVVAFGKNTGFWLVHSTPKFPQNQTEGYAWPKSAYDFGQTFLCISLSKKQMENVGIQLQYNYPQIYDKYFPESLAAQYPQMAAVAMESPQKHPTKDPWYSEIGLTSLGGIDFRSFAKFSKFNADLYSPWLASSLGIDLFVETWQNGNKSEKLNSSCKTQFKVYNVENITFTYEATFVESKDHSKWATSTSASKTWTCIGDINRMESQFHRAGGTVCFQHPTVWKSFYKLIGKYEKCPQQ
ncbi:hypothetical protein ACJMK2_038462 [Sinanodonta woodiana]|uniref:Uncharacterized protein n=1 Tax=Sinanodonta woodiana TaxID=1069815 RepID=A0ABD3W915_SINWO